jgi:hypothetical protein
MPLQLSVPPQRHLGLRLRPTWLGPRGLSQLSRRLDSSRLTSQALV